MIRKYLFWGLTLVLIVVVVNLIVRGRQMEKEQASKKKEIVQQSKPTATRILSPTDLAVTNASMQLEPPQTARHRVEIRNNGTVPYTKIQLKLAYVSQSGSPLAARTYSIERTVSPGSSLKLDDILLQGIPAGASSAQVTVLYADFNSGEARE